MDSQNDDPLFLETQRLRLRGWRQSDLDGFAAIMADPIVMASLGGVMARSDAWRALAFLLGHWQLRGYGMWAVERKSDGALLGRIGLHYPEGWPGPEVGWTLGSKHWGQGYATEAAAAALEHGFETQALERLISCIAPDNKASQAVAQRLGMQKGEASVLVIRGESHPIDIWSIPRQAWRGAPA